MGGVFGARNGVRDTGDRRKRQVCARWPRSACDSGGRSRPWTTWCGSLEEADRHAGQPFAHLAASGAGVTMTDVTTTESYGSSAFTRTGLAVLASSAPARLLLHLVVLVSSAASILQCCGFVDGPELEVKLLVAAAGLQLLASSNLRAVHIPASSIWIDRRRASSLLTLTTGGPRVSSD
ncbi:hypothetical protein ZWY2020_011349 [Hordeum vulgare]|nr:hypothetical protein ZWY2020_011349 [Hordeum vulgare]